MNIVERNIMLIFAQTINSRWQMLKFTKMHGAGNDYIYINGIEFCPINLSKLAIKMSNRHKGIGSDGLVIIKKSEVADFGMQMFNADGSEGEMCGNASCCLGKYLYEKNLTRKHTISLETKSGIKILSLAVNDNEVSSVTIDMGAPIFEPEKIPLSIEIEAIRKPIMTSMGEILLTGISMGNPHGVVFVDDLNKIDVSKIGKELELNTLFPHKSNIEFAEIINSNEIKMKVWERGSGETLSCGTGACATVVAGAVSGLCSRNSTVYMPGGSLRVEWLKKNDHVYLTGEAEFVFEGEYKLELTE